VLIGLEIMNAGVPGGYVAEEPIHGCRSGLGCQRVDLAVVQHGRPEVQLVGAVKAAAGASVDVGEACGIGVAGLPLRQDGHQRGLVGRGHAVVRSIAADEDVPTARRTSRAAGDVTRALVADQQAAAAPACDGVGAAAPDEDVALGVPGQGVAAVAAVDVLDVADRAGRATVDVRGRPGREVDYDRCGERRVVQPVALMRRRAAAVDVGDLAAAAEREDIDAGAADQLTKLTECERTVLALLPPMASTRLVAVPATPLTLFVCRLTLTLVV
jgi:hypothetical protein